MATDVPWEVVDQVVARWKIAVSVDGDVIIWAPRVDLTEAEQERFAQAYVSAVFKAKAKRAERRASGMNAVERAARDLIGIPDGL